MTYPLSRESFLEAEDFLGNVSVLADLKFLQL